jgi:vinculin
VTKEVERRIEDLTHQIHREILGRCVDQIKTLAPILICSMKIFIQILAQGDTNNPGCQIFLGPSIPNWEKCNA